MIDHLWQSTLFVGVAWLLTLALKKNRAQVRYWIWFTASVKFLAPLALLIAVGELAPRRAERPMAQAQWVVVAQQIGEPSIALPVVSGTTDRARRDYLAPVLLAVWACGFLGVAICWLARWRRVGALRRLATPVRGIEFAVPVMAAPGLIEPGIFGIFRPVLLLPEGIGERLTPEQLDAILAHELCHVRRRDNLTATIHIVVQAIFWFHPLVWWVGARLVDERERACDEEVLRLGSKPGVYAEGILNVCKLYVESPLACVSGVTGSNLKRRIEAIMKNRSACGLSFANKAFLAVAGIAAVAAPIAVGILDAQPASTATPKFEVAAIRPCDPNHVGVGGVGNGSMGVSPGALHVKCVPVIGLIRFAYVRFGDASSKTIFGRDSISGGPAWIKSEEYDIEAKAVGTPNGQMLEDPMLQALLEDRFKLKIHRETREIPVYELTVAKKGFRLEPLKEGSCTRPAPLAKQCGLFGPTANNSAELTSVDLWGMSLDQICEWLSRRLDRPIINKTGVTGLFTLRLEFAPDQATPSSLPSSTPGTAPLESPAGGPSIFTAVQEQLGLKLEPAKGPGEFLIIDHVERPSEN